MKQEIIYLDSNATLPASKKHIEQLCSTLLEHTPANSSSPHALGRSASVFITHARKTVAQTLGVNAADIVFTSGGTEANQLGIMGTILESLKLRSQVHAISSNIEHPCVTKQFDHLNTKQNVSTSIVKSSNLGFVDITDVIKEIKPNTVLITLMAANNEIGTVQNVKLLGDFLNYVRYGDPQNILTLQEKQELEHLKTFLNEDVSPQSLINLHFHVDAVQAYGKIKHSQWMSVGIDSCAISAHKIGALQGTGVLYLKRGRKYQPLFFGGAQEKNRRAGTENGPGIISFGIAAQEMLMPQWWDELDRVNQLKKQIHTYLSKFNFISLNSCLDDSLPNTIHFNFTAQSGFDAEDVIVQMDMNGICISSGSACSSSLNLPSHVIKALGKNDADAKNCIRISLSHQTKNHDIDILLREFENIFIQK